MTDHPTVILDPGGDVVDDTSSQLGGDPDVNGNAQNILLVHRVHIKLYF